MADSTISSHCKTTAKSNRLSWGFITDQVGHQKCPPSALALTVKPLETRSKFSVNKKLYNMKQHYNITTKQAKAVNNLYNLKVLSVGNTHCISSIH
jgi:uncharacterized protein (DUF169 family)